jgi:hypothetical protein
MCRLADVAGQQEPPTVIPANFRVSGDVGVSSAFSELGCPSLSSVTCFLRKKKCEELKM